MTSAGVHDLVLRVVNYCRYANLKYTLQIQSFVEAHICAKQNVLMWRQVGGLEGAALIVRYLQQRGVKLDFVLDEGGFIIQDGLPPLTRTPLALVGTAEKVVLALRAPQGQGAQTGTCEECD